MPMDVLNNPSAMLTLGELNKNINKAARGLKRLASGERITGAGDDASGYAISEKMRVRVRALGQADDNTQTGCSMLRVAEGGIQNQIEILKNITRKVLDANNDTNTDIDRATIQKEIDQGYDQMEDIAYTTNYNGRLLLCGNKVMKMDYTNWGERTEPEFGTCQNDTRDLNLITKTVKDDKNENVDAASRTLTGMNRQNRPGALPPATDAESVYDTAAVYSSDIASLRPTTGDVANSLDMANGVDWKPTQRSIQLDTSGTADDVLNRLKNKTFTVTLNDNGVTRTETFTFADDLSYSDTCTFSYTYSYTDYMGNPVGPATDTATTSCTVTPKRTYDTSATTTVSLQWAKNHSGGNGTEAANWALGALSDTIARVFTQKYGAETITTDGSGSASQSKIYGDSISGGKLVLASGKFDFSITDSGTTPPLSTAPIGNGSAYSACSYNTAQAQTNALNAVMAKGDYGSAPSVSNFSYTPPTVAASVNGTATPAINNSLQSYQQEQSAYVDIKLDDLLKDENGNDITDVETLIDQFLFKYRDDELNADDVDTSDADTMDTGNNLVVDKSFSYLSSVISSAGIAYGGVTYEFIDTGRDNTGKQYLYDEQKLAGSETRDLNQLRAIAGSATGKPAMKKALAQFLYNSLDYVSGARERVYTRELMDGSGNVTNAAGAESIRLYAYRPYDGTMADAEAINSKTTTPSYMQQSAAAGYNYHYASGRYSGAGTEGNTQKMTTEESYLSSYDFDVKDWWRHAIGDPESAGDEYTEQRAGTRLNGRGFRFYCGAEGSDYKEWINIYFTDHSVEDDIGERPAAGDGLTTGDALDTIIVDVRGVRNYKDLVTAIYQQANSRNGAGGAAGQQDNVGQAGFNGNPTYADRAHTDYFTPQGGNIGGESQHFLFAADVDNGILTVWDTDRYAHNNEMRVSDGVYDNIRLEYRNLYEERLIIHDTDKASQAICIHIPRTTLDYVLNYNPETTDASKFNVMTKAMRERLLGNSKGANGILDRGLEYLTNANALVGAHINRLEYSHANLTTSVENTQASESTIRDADMAKEMTEYTKNNLLAQAAQSMLAQANQNGSQVLGLLQ